ncbi:MAG TPA: EAL domain-containing protein [Methylophilaceae bacterium]|nr:EAL domain-containing protein [Methylophilaceae bacterium]
MRQMYKNPHYSKGFWLPRHFLLLTALAFVYWAGAQIGLLFTTLGTYASLIWPSAGVSLAALLVFGYRIWPGILLGAFLAEYSMGIPALAAGIIAIGNMLEALAGCYLLRRIPGFDPALVRLRDLLALIVLAAGLSTLISASIASGTLQSFGLVDPNLMPTVFQNWWMGDALSNMLFAPAVLSIFFHQPLRWSKAKLVEAGILSLLMLAACLMVFQGVLANDFLVNPRAFILFPLMLWAALSFHQRGAALATIFASLMALIGGLNHTGFFAQDFLLGDLTNYWLFVLVLSGIGFSLSALNTGRIRSEVQLREQLDFYDALIDAQSDAGTGIVVQEQGKIVYSNDALWHIGGYQPGDILLGSDFINLIHPSERKRVSEIQKKRLAGEQVPGRYESCMLAKNGHAVPVEIAAALYQDGSDRVVALITNISERKQAEAELAQSQQDYRELVESVQAIMWRAIPGGAFTFVSQEAEALLGYPLAEWTESPTFWMDIIHPDDRGWVVEYCLTESAKLKSHVFDYRLIASDGRIVWVQDIVKVIPNSSRTRPQELVGVMLDITARKEAEAGLKLSRQVFDNTAEGILITDAYFNVLEVNQAYLNITGYNREEVIGEKPVVMSTGLHNQQYYDELWQTLREEGKWVGEIWSRRKNGESYPEWLSISAVTDSKKIVQNYVAVFTDITQRKQSEERLQFLANHDALTHLPNRMLLQERIEQGLLRARRSHGKLAVLFIDLDRFKVINDTLGHQAGDMLLQEAARRLKECLRVSDTVARQGGDEFVVLVEDFADTQYLTAVARKIMGVLAQPFILLSQELYISASIGISVYPEDGVDLFSLLKNADVAMYRAKEGGKNTFQFYAAESNVHSLERLTLENSLRRALERKEFVLHYQAKLNLRTGKIIGAEALLRWQHPELGLIKPAEFISLAEETGLIIPVGAWVLEEACREAYRWQKVAGHSLRVGVNLSARQFREDGLHQTIANALAHSGLTADCLELEITESMIMQNAERATGLLQHFRELGTHVLIDDFGTGYSSLGYLKHFPIDSLKIDRSFVRDIPQDSDDMAITQAIIALARSLNLRVVAEGVENVEQLKYLREQGCDLMQGYIFSMPLPADEFMEFLSSNAELPLYDLDVEQA